MSKQEKIEALRALEAAEDAFLVAFGWTYQGPDKIGEDGYCIPGGWKPPPGYLAQKRNPPETGEEWNFNRGKAINSQKYRLLSHGGAFLDEALGE